MGYCAFVDHLQLYIIHQNSQLFEMINTESIELHVYKHPQIKFENRLNDYLLT